MKTIGLLLLALFASPALAVEPDEMLDDPALEERARVISQDLRCVVCQNETIDDSNATLAQDMRRLVRQRVLAGDSNDEVLDYMVDRYGDFVLLRPRVTPVTWLLWFGPVLLLGAGTVVVLRAVKRQTAQPATDLSDADQERLTALLSKDEAGS